MSNVVNLSMKLENVRLSRVSLASPFQGRPDASGKVAEAKYHVDAIIEPTHPQLPQLKELMRAAIVAKFGERAPQVTLWIAANNKLCLHNGDVDRAGKPEYAGKLYVSLGNKDQPTVAVCEGNKILSTIPDPARDIGLLTPAHPRYPYGGCYADVIFNLSAYDHQGSGSKGVSGYLNGVQFRAHGERIRTSGVASNTEFTLIPDTADSAPPATTVAGSTASAGLI